MDKALLPVAGTPSYARVARALSAIADDVWVVRREDQSAIATDGYVAGVLFDLRPGAGPLAGLESGLTHMRHDWGFVLPADAPLVRHSLLRLLVAACDRLPAASPVRAIILRQGDRVYPLLGLYHRAALAVVKQALDQGRRRVMDLLENMPVRYLPEAEWRAGDPEGVSLLMMNTEAEYQEVCDRLLGGLEE